MLCCYVLCYNTSTMSRIVTIKSTSEIVEKDIAEDVVAELRAQGKHALAYDEQAKCFTDQQYDDRTDSTVAEAEHRYFVKLQQRVVEQAEKTFEASKYKIEKVREGNKIKLVARRPVYA